MTKAVLLKNLNEKQSEVWRLRYRKRCRKYSNNTDHQLRRVTRNMKPKKLMRFGARIAEVAGGMDSTGCH
jgi:hypothetical protein